MQQLSAVTLRSTTPELGNVLFDLATHQGAMLIAIRLSITGTLQSDRFESYASLGYPLELMDDQSIPGLRALPLSNEEWIHASYHATGCRALALPTV